MGEVVDLRTFWLWFADSVGGGYSPLYSRIARVVADNDEVLALVQQGPPQSHMPNVLLAAVHYLVLGGLDHPLAPVYAGTSDADPGPLFIDVCLTHRDDILQLLATRHTNTNEVGRSAIVAVALQAVADRVGAPLAFVDVGCSAGANLLVDRYRIDYGAAGATGPADAPVQIACAITGGRPPIAPKVPEIVERVGIDVDPVDVTDADQLQWQLALVFPDTGRLERTRRALAELQLTPPRIVKGDATNIVKDVLGALPAHVPAIVTTTWVAAYFLPDGRTAFREQLTAASHHRPVAWVSAEGAGVVDLFGEIHVPVDAQGTAGNVLGLAHFRAGELTTDVLGFVHPHGNWIDWQAS